MAPESMSRAHAVAPARHRTGPVPDEGAVPPVEPEPRLSVAAVARRLGIAPATLRTWDRRYGIGPTDHSPGRHRRYSPDDVARLELMQHALVRGAGPAEAAHFARAARLPRPDADPPDRPRAVPPLADEPGAGPADLDCGGGDIGDPLLLADADGEAAARVRVGGRVLRLPGASRRARGLGRAALALDAVAVRRLLEEGIADDGIAATWQDVARPVLVAVAERWAFTGAGVEIEHLVSECVAAVFGARAASVPTSAGRPVLLAGMPGEHHTLPMTVLAAVLAEQGVGCRPLGADLPADALASAVRRTAPAAVVLWAQLPAAADPAVPAGLPSTRPRYRTFVAGPGWDEVTVPPRVVALSTLDEAVAMLVACASA